MVRTSAAPAHLRRLWSERHACNSSTACGRPSPGARRRGRWRWQHGRSPTCTPTPSSRCSTGPPGSTDLVAGGRRPTGSRRSAITDHGNMYGVLDFYKACRAAGHQPDHRHRGLHGRRVPPRAAGAAGQGRRHRRRRRGRREALLPPDAAGRDDRRATANLLKLSSAAYLEGYYYKPRVDWELLERHHDGLIATTGCLGGVVLQALLAGDVRGGRAAGRPAAGHLRARQPLRRAAGPRPRRAAADQPAADRDRPPLGAPLLATNDSHYTPPRGRRRPRRPAVRADRGDASTTRSASSSTATEHYLKSAAEMRHLFAEVPEACDNTLLDRRAGQRRDRARQAEPARVPGARRVRRRRPTRTGPLGLPAPPDLRGRARALRRPAARPTVRERLDYELGVIADMGFSAYFLVVWDLIRYARESGIRVGPGRGSAAGCCVAYCLRIVDLDPIRYDLLFERFLNPGRKQMPDIDMDFDERYRGEMIRYAAERYGWDHVAQIVTFSTIKARAAVRDAARVLGLPVHRRRQDRQGHAAARHGPRHAAVGLPRRRARASRTATRRRPSCGRCTRHDPEAKQVIDVARGLEGLRRQDGIHAAAVVITNEPLTEYLPIQRKPEAGGEPGGRADRHPVRDARGRGARPAQDGLPRAAQPVGHRAGPRPHRADDAGSGPTSTASPSTTRRPSRCCAGATRSASSSSRAGRCARCALARPDQLRRRGRPRRPLPARARWRPTCTATTRTGRTAASRSRYLHPDLEPILGDTYGLMLYQESVMRVAQKFAGLHARGGRQPPQGLRQEDPRAHRRRAGEVRRRLRRPRATARSSAPSCSTSSSRSPTTPSTSPTPTATASSPTRRPG